MLLTDKASTKIVKQENFTMSEALAEGASSYADMTITGRYYAPDEGYIDLSTPATIRILAGDD